MTDVSDVHDTEEDVKVVDLKEGTYASYFKCCIEEIRKVERRRIGSRIPEVRVENSFVKVIGEGRRIRERIKQYLTVSDLNSLHKISKTLQRILSSSPSVPTTNDAFGVKIVSLGLTNGTGRENKLPQLKPKVPARLSTGEMDDPIEINSSQSSQQSSQPSTMGSSSSATTALQPQSPRSSKRNKDKVRMVEN